jgi:hypothetical protein
MVSAKYDQMSSNEACFEFLDQKSGVSMRFFAQFCARRTRLARARYVNPSINPERRMDGES